MFNTPILFIVFNRPDTTKQVFDQIKKIQPKKLYIASDGPRVGNKEDSINCALVHEITDAVDWECEVKKLYREENAGFSKNIKHALKWFFEQEEAGIILEDDCLPSHSFFKFCELMLEKYKNNEDVQFISGSNFCTQPISNTTDYFIGDIGYIWGWATWRSAFNKIIWQSDYSLKEIEDKLFSVFEDKEYVSHFYSIVNHFYKNFDCWDVEFFVYTIMNNRKKILPNVNLISNIGNSGTHYNNSENKLLNVKAFDIDFNIFDVNNYTFLNASLKKRAITEFVKKANYLSFRDKLYWYKRRFLTIINK